MSIQTDAYTKRRSRWEHSWMRYIEIQERDLQYLLALYKHGSLDARMLHELVSPSVKQVQTTRRLQRLYARPHCYVDRPHQQRQYANANYRFLIYEINKKGIQLLAERGLTTEETRLWRANRHTRGAYRNFAHEGLVASIFGSIELAVKRDPTLRYIPWYEIFEKAPVATKQQKRPLTVSVTIIDPSTNKPVPTKITPDGLFGVQYGLPDGTYRFAFFAVEADRGTEPGQRKSLKGSSFFKKFLAYQQLIKQNIHTAHFGLPNLRVLTITKSDAHAVTLKDVLATITPKSELFLFDVMPTLGMFDQSPMPNPLILSNPVTRVGLPPIRLNQP